jgi:hypothetical protein
VDDDPRELPRAWDFAASRPKFSLPLMTRR